MSQSSGLEGYLQPQSLWMSEPRWKRYAFLRDLERYKLSPYLDGIVLIVHRNQRYSLMADAELSDSEYVRLKYLKATLKYLTRVQANREWDPNYRYSITMFNEAFERLQRLFVFFSPIVLRYEVAYQLRRRLRRHRLLSTASSSPVRRA